MYDIHLIEKTASYYREGERNETDTWVTGTWELADETAQRLESSGGSVYLHTKQDAPCYLGGDILNVTKVGIREPGKLQRYEIRFRFNASVMNTRTGDCERNWSTEMLLER